MKDVGKSAENFQNIQELIPEMPAKFDEQQKTQPDKIILFNFYRHIKNLRENYFQT